MNNTVPAKNRKWTQVLAKGKQFLFLLRHISVLPMAKSSKSLDGDKGIKKST
jgi:hypothetical protein